MSESVLILSCTNVGCVTDTPATNRTPDGVREWTARFRTVPDPDHPGYDMREPVDGEPACRCPDCGARGHLWSY